MKYFRLYEDNPGHTPFGYGRSGARWNLPDTPMIYLCSQSSLNYLEHLSIRWPVVSGISWTLVTYKIKIDIPNVKKDDLPGDWNAAPYPVTTQQFGSNWARGMISPFLKVPSARLPLSRFPEEHNLLLNPFHLDFKDNIEVLHQEVVEYLLDLKDE
jgi:RES domain-containing protein